MQFRPGTRAALAALCVATCAAGAQPASAQGLFEILFGGPGYRERDFPPPPRQPQRRAPVERAAPATSGDKESAPARISAPSYNTYKADSLKKIALALPAAASTDSASAEGADFREASAALGEETPLAERDIADALAAYYAENPRFLWLTDSAPNMRAQAVLRVLGDAASYGLDPADYAVSVPAAAVAKASETAPVVTDVSTTGTIPVATDEPAAPAGVSSQLAELMRFELTLSARALRYVSDAERGRILPNRISGYYDFASKPLDFKVALNDLATDPDPAAYLESRHPRNEQYRQLRVELEALRRSTEETITVDPKMLLKPGETHPDFPNLLALIQRKANDAWRTEFGDVVSAHVSDPVYAEDLVPAIEAAQKIVGLKPDGVIGPRTVAAFAGQSVADRIRKVEIAMEQLRWLPSEFGARYVFVNQPAFTASYVENGVDKLSMKVVVGKPTNQTSFFSDEIEQVDYNPYWGVPQSIIVNEMLPRLRSDPGYLDRSGYEVTDLKGRHIPSSSIDWSAYGSKVPFNIRQTPSEANALGELKILFPNKHAIYMHDTPEKSLFKRDVRAFSHGCIRLQDPRGMAAAVLGEPIEHVVEKLKQGHSSERLKEKVPVYVAYFTAWPDDSGKVQYFADIYGRDARVQKAIETTEGVRQAGA